MSGRRLVEADVTFRSKNDGGRDYPVGMLEGFKFRPGIVRGDPNQREPLVDSGGNYVEVQQGVAFLSGPQQVTPGTPLRATFGVVGWPSSYTDWIQPGETFTIREGPKIIGSGRVVRAWTEDAT